MQIEIKVPEVGESVQEAILSQWFKRDGDLVRKGELLFLLETDKVTLEISAEADGILRIVVPEGATVKIGAVVATLDTESVDRVKAARPEEKPMPSSEPAPRVEVFQPSSESAPKVEPPLQASLAPSVMKLVEKMGVDTAKISGTGPGGRITQGDVLLYLEEAGTIVAEAIPPGPRGIMGDRPTEAPVAQPMPRAEIVAPEEEITRKPMSPIRRRIAERLVAAKQNTATLTTFNEIDVSRLQEMRALFKEAYRERFGASLGIMSFFVKAAIQALKEYPEVNAFIDGKDIVYHHYYHIGVAIGAERGLVVPVIRHAERLGFAEIERSIADYVQKIKENRLEISDLEGGTFTITNGGVYGSLLSTPLLNFPQSAILGMHKIENRPVALGNEVVVRPMMYVALTYDHRIIDGREAVSFLKRIKECVENPERIMLEI